MKKKLLCIAASTFVLCAALHHAHGMESDMEIDKDPLTCVKEYRIRSIDSYRKGQEAENLWEKRKYYLQALRSSREISENFPDFVDQGDANQYKLIQDTLDQCAHQQWRRGMQMLMIAEILRSENAAVKEDISSTLTETTPYYQSYRGDVHMLSETY